MNLHGGGQGHGTASTQNDNNKKEK